MLQWVARTSDVEHVPAEAAQEAPWLTCSGMTSATPCRRHADAFAADGSGRVAGMKLPSPASTY